MQNPGIRANTRPVGNEGEQKDGWALQREREWGKEGTSWNKYFLTPPPTRHPASIMQSGGAPNSAGHDCFWETHSFYSEGRNLEGARMHFLPRLLPGYKAPEYFL